jgi:cyclophilin family peptidyl-prolyl cis-trans isomerase
MCIDPSHRYTAIVTTTAGAILVDLDTTHTPRTTNNFVVLARYRYYDGSSFPRTDQSIDIIQGGAPSTQTIADPGPGYTIDDEPDLPVDANGGVKGHYAYHDGDLVMARTSGPDSASAQFFFAAGPKVERLDAQGSYVVFGHVTDGLGVLHQILASSTECPPADATCVGGRPNPPVVVSTVVIQETP